MKFAPMNYHYLRYPIRKFLDKVERSPFDSIDLYCSAPQLNLFDYPLSRLIELKKEIEARHLSVMAMTPENCVYPVNFVLRMILQGNQVSGIISGRSTQRSFLTVRAYRSVPDSDTSISQEKRAGNTAGNRCGRWRSIAKTKTSNCF